VIEYNRSLADKLARENHVVWITVYARPHLSHMHQRCAVITVCLLGLAIVTITLRAAAPKPAVPTDPIHAILDAFRSHRVVALGEGRHGNEQGHSFRLALIRDPRFPTVVNDIVVESGTAQHQDVMDRFVRGEEVPQDQFRHVWQDTIQTTAVWDVSIYEEFFRAVRDVNAMLPRSRQLRILLGSQPIDWSGVRTRADDQRELLRFSDAFPADVIEREVLRKGRRALVVFGEGHLHRWSSGSIVNRLEGNGTRVYSIVTATLGDAARVDPAVATWPRPALASLRGTALGAVDYDFWVGGVPDPPHVRPADQDFDALLYFGPPSSITLAHYGEALCGDPAYLATRLSRIQFRGSVQDALEVTKACERQRAK
jgi:hypothetical protein